MLAALLAGLTLASSAQLPVGQHYSGLGLSTTGVPWVTAGRGPYQSSPGRPVSGPGTMSFSYSSQPLIVPRS